MHTQLILIKLLTFFWRISLSANECIILTSQGDTNWRKPSCKTWLEDGYKHSGIYMIYPFTYNASKGVKVYCDQDTDGGGWVLIQRRIDGRVDFYRNWKSYQEGFGNIGGEHWLGLDYIHRITSSGNYELRIDLEDFEDEKRFAKYRNFIVSDTTTNYTLNISEYSENAGDSLHIHNNMMFSTFDRDNDIAVGSCAEKFHGAWWYSECHNSNLNGAYGETAYGKGIIWYSWHNHNYSMKTSEMKIRPRQSPLSPAHLNADSIN